MNKFTAIVKKECKDNLRDRRALFSALAPAFFAPIFLVGMITFMLDKLRGDSDDPIEFSVLGAHHAPGLMSHINTDGQEEDHPRPVPPSPVEILTDASNGEEPETISRFHQMSSGRW